MSGLAGFPGPHDGLGLIRNEVKTTRGSKVIQSVLCKKDFSVHCCENNHGDGSNENREIFRPPSNQGRDSGVKVPFQAQHRGPGK